MNRGLRFATQRRRRLDRKAAVRGVYPGALCAPTSRGDRAIVASLGAVIAEGSTANNAWWAAWSITFPDQALRRMYPKGRRR